MAFIRRIQDPPLVQSMAKSIQLLAGDAPIPSVVPFMYHHHLLDICSSVINGDTEHNNLQKMKQYGFQLDNTLQIAITNGFGITCAKFYQYLVDQVAKVHAHDRYEPKQYVITDSYNPETGVAYYFTPHGIQVHK